MRTLLELSEQLGTEIDADGFIAGHLLLVSPEAQLALQQRGQSAVVNKEIDPKGLEQFVQMEKTFRLMASLNEHINLAVLSSNLWIAGGYLPQSPEEAEAFQTMQRGLNQAVLMVVDSERLLAQILKRPDEPNLLPTSWYGAVNLFVNYTRSFRKTSESFGRRGFICGDKEKDAALLADGSWITRDNGLLVLGALMLPSPQLREAYSALSFSDR